MAISYAYVFPQRRRVSYKNKSLPHKFSVTTYIHKYVHIHVRIYVCLLERDTNSVSRNYVYTGINATGQRPWSNSARLVKKYTSFIESEGSLPNSQDPAFFLTLFTWHARLDAEIWTTSCWHLESGVKFRLHDCTKHAVHVFQMPRV